MDGCTCLERNKKRGPSAIAFRNAHWDMDGCTCLERNKKMQVHWPWHSGMLTGTWMDAHRWKEIKKCRSVGHGIQECSLGHGWMYQAGKNKCRSIGHGIGSCKYLSGMRFMYLLFQHHHPHIK